MSPFAPLLLLAALAAPPQPSVVPEGMPGAGPTLARRVALSAPLPGEALSLAWAGGRLVATDGAALWLVDPRSGAVSAGALPPPPAAKKRSKKAPPPAPLAPSSIALGPGGAAAMVALDTVWVFDPTSGAVRWKAPAGGATRVQWSVDGAAVEGGGNQRHVVWSASSGTPLEAPDTRAPAYVYASLRQRMAVLVGGRLEIYDPGGVAALLEDVEIQALALSPDGSRLAAGGRGLWLWDAETRGAPLLARDRVVRALALSPDGRRLAVAVEGEEAIEVYDATSGEALTGVRASGGVRGLAWAADGALVWLGADALHSAVVVERDLRASLPGQAAITALAADQGWLAAGSASGGLAVWGPDGALVWGDQGPGRVERLALDLEGERLAVRQEGDHLLDLATGARAACAPETPPCAALDRPPEANATPADLSAWIAPDARTVSLGDAIAEAAGDQLRVWRAGALAELRWFGEDGSWARWAEGRYTWGAMDPPLRERGGAQAPVLPPKASAVLMLDRGAAELFDGGPPVSLSVLLTNTGPGPVYGLRVEVESDGLARVEGGTARARLGPGERLLLPLTLHATPARTGEGTVNLVLRSLYTGPQPYAMPVRVGPFPVSLKAAKVKGDHAKLTILSAGGPALGATQVWLAAQGAGGAWTVLGAGEEGRAAPVPYGEKPTSPILADTLDLSAAGELRLEYELPEKKPARLELVLLVPGGAPITLPISTAR